jgi:DNA polymerase-3 subunit gamma/tau
MTSRHNSHHDSPAPTTEVREPRQVREEATVAEPFRVLDRRTITRSDDREAEGARLEIVCTERYRGFESLSLRHALPMARPMRSLFWWSDAVSYLVLARKYRPSTFADIVGQEHVVRTLENAIRLDRVHHAFLFTGARGVGKTTTARVLARALNCERGPTPTPCGKCAACMEIASGSSTDVLEIDGASNNGIDNIRELRENVRYLPNRGRFKLYIIDEVHMVTQAAFNALLKTLEEPPAHAKFIFATTEPQKIPVTILSRCQRFDFRKVAMKELTDHLRRILAQEGASVSPTALHVIVREAQGSVRDALSLLDQVLSYSADQLDDATVLEALGAVDRQTIFACFDAILAKDADRLLLLIAEIDTRGYDLAEVAGLLVEHVRDLLVAKLVSGPAASVLDRSPGELEALSAQAQKVSSADLQRLFSILVAVAEDTSRSSFPRISLEMGLLCLFEVEPTPSLKTLLERLDTMVAQPPSAPADGGSSARPSSSPSVKENAAAREAPGDAPALWAQFVSRVRGERPALASLLEHARLIHFGPESVEIGYGRSSFYWETARERGNIALVERLVAEHFGRPVPFSVKALDDASCAEGAMSLAEIALERRHADEKKVRVSALDHPAVRSAISILGGEVKEVIPLSRPSEES